MITLPTQIIPWFNLILLIFYMIFVMTGFKRGFLRQILMTIGTVLSYLAAWRYSSIGASYFHIWPASWTFRVGLLPKAWLYPLLNHTAWFFLILIGCRLLFSLLDRFAKGIQGIPILKQISSLLGGILGACTATIWVLIACFALYTPLFRNGDVFYQKTALHTIHDTTMVFFKQLDEPIKEMMDYHSFWKTIDEHKEDDQKWITQWLEEHGFAPLDGDQK